MPAPSHAPVPSSVPMLSVSASSAQPTPPGRMRKCATSPAYGLSAVAVSWEGSPLCPLRLSELWRGRPPLPSGHVYEDILNGCGRQQDMLSFLRHGVVRDSILAAICTALSTETPPSPPLQSQ